MNLLIVNFINMKQYRIKSPSNKIFLVYGETVYHAIQYCVHLENYQYSNLKYKKI